MRLGFDIDDCITKTTETFCKIGNDLFNLGLVPDLLTSNSVKFEDLGLVTNEQVAQIKEEYYRLHIFRNIEPHESAIQSLRLVNDETIYFITSRNDYDMNELTKDTHYWFKTHGIKNYELIFTDDKYSVINELKLDIFVEDNISQIQKLQYIDNLRIIMPKRPWNHEKAQSLTNVESVDRWDEIIQKIKQYDQKN